MLHEACVLTVEKLVVRAEGIVDSVKSRICKNHFYKVAVHSECINATVLMKNGDIDTDYVVCFCKIGKFLANTSYVCARNAEAVDNSKNKSSSAAAVIDSDNTNTLIIIDSCCRL